MDKSAVMLANSRNEVARCSTDSPCEFIESDWFDIAYLPTRPDFVVGDNSFAFLDYPGDWQHLCRAVSATLPAGGVLITRALTTPLTHRRRSPADIVALFEERSVMNCSELRAMLLFAQWDPNTYGIVTEAATRAYDKNKALFDKLLRRHPEIGPTNDLATVLKYRGTGAIYYAPPIPDLLAAFDPYFEVTAVLFGPYAMSAYFPLLICRKRQSAT
jgi:hypothetical protein